MSSLTPDRTQAIRTGATDVFTPVIAAVNRPMSAAATYVQTVTGIAELQAENARLQAENARLRDWYQAALQLQARNQSLEQMLNVVAEPRQKFITARVIADSRNTYVKTLLVLAGQRDGVERGQAVIATDGLIGRTVEVGQKSSRILLLTDINARVPVFIEGSQTRAILAGNNTDLPLLEHLPAEMEPEIGANVITSGHGGLFPFGLPVGKVVLNEHGRPAVELYADLNNLIYVRVVDRGDNPNLIPGGL